MQMWIMPKLEYLVSAAGFSSFQLLTVAHLSSQTRSLLNVSVEPYSDAVQNCKLQPNVYFWPCWASGMRKPRKLEKADCERLAGWPKAAEDKAPEGPLKSSQKAFLGPCRLFQVEKDAFCGESLYSEFQPWYLYLYHELSCENFRSTRRRCWRRPGVQTILFLGIASPMMQLVQGSVPDHGRSTEPS